MHDVTTETGNALELFQVFIIQTPLKFNISLLIQ